MELDIWLGDESELMVKEQDGKVRFSIGTRDDWHSIELPRTAVRTLYLSLKYWHDLGEDN